jgi:hypothetical protein
MGGLDGEQAGGWLSKNVSHLSANSEGSDMASKAVED